jgi:hypothetical protein
MGLIRHENVATPGTWCSNSFYSKPQGNTTMPERPLTAEGLVQPYDTGDMRAVLAICTRQKNASAG